MKKINLEKHFQLCSPRGTRNIYYIRTPHKELAHEPKHRNTDLDTATYLVKYMNIFSHSNPLFPADTSHWESLVAHLNNTADLAGEFAKSFNNSEIAKMIATLHDVGKASDEFQKFLLNVQTNPKLHGPDHSTAGAKFISDRIPGLGEIFAYAIAGHHAGLPDGRSSDNSSLDIRLKKEIPSWKNNFTSIIGKSFLKQSILSTEELREIISTSPFLRDGFSVSMWIRMLFSTLVDADFLATENFMSAGKSQKRKTVPTPTIEVLEKRLTNYIQTISKGSAPVTEINKIRNEIREDCLSAAEHNPGLFTLTVPTGGGKTLSSLAFALKHAKKFGLERIIYVIPFTSIIEQNAKVFKDAIGEDAVLEHHSNFDYESQKHDDESTTSPLREQQKLATENWDSPIVVTTNVQFYESLFSHKPSRCRKLHNISKSVIILDEAQTLPIDKLLPCLRVIDELVQNYGSTVVLCTATQPAINKTEKFSKGLQGNTFGIREIISPKRNLHKRLKRVQISQIPNILSDEEVAKKIAQEKQVLCIVNTRGNAKKIFEALKNYASPKDNSIFHLSAQMCAAHRFEIFDKIRKCLKENLPCRVVSTQLIEAGVDIDFPCVYRAMAGIDSIAQAAGRCNREGKIGGVGGRVFIFETEKNSPIGFLRNTADTGKEILGLDDFGKDPLSQETVSKYFNILYWSQGDQQLDKLKVLSELLPKERPKSKEDLVMFKFRSLGEKFQIIDENTESVIIPYGEDGAKLCEQLRNEYNPTEQRKILRNLQRYTIGVYKNQFEMAKGKLIQMIHEKYPVLISTITNYDNDFGLTLEINGTGETPIF